MKRRLIFFALIVGPVLLAGAFRTHFRNSNSLSSDEVRFVGKWELLTVGSPAAKNSVTFTPDRRFSTDGAVGLDSRWSVANDRLTIDHRYKVTLFREHISLPLRKTGSFRWKVKTSENPNRIELKSEDKLSDLVLIRNGK